MNWLLIAGIGFAGYVAVLLSLGALWRLWQRWLYNRRKPMPPLGWRKAERERQAAADRTACVGIILRSYSNEELTVLTEHSEWIRVNRLDGGES